MTRVTRRHSIRNHCFVFLFSAGLALAGCRSDKGISRDAPPRSGSDAADAGTGVVRLTQAQALSSIIEVVKAGRRMLGTDVEALGEVASDPDHVIQLRPAGPGTLQEWLVAVGDVVRAGQALMKYRPEGGGTIAEWTSDHAGVLIGMYAEPGTHVDPAVPLASLADTSRLRCGLDVYEKDIGRVRRGQKVAVTVATYPDQVFEGTVSYISLRVDENTRTVKVRADVANPEGKLKFGMFVTGRIHVAEREALVVPETAVQDLQGRPIVFVPRDALAFVPRDVTLGEHARGWVEVISGLRPGESIVSRGSLILKSRLLNDRNAP